MHLEFGEKLTIHKLDLCPVKVEQGVEFMGTGFHLSILSNRDRFNQGKTSF